MHVNIVKKTFLKILIVFVLGACTAHKAQTTPADWVTHYDTIEDMIDQSDFIVITKVASQTLEVRVDMVFTMSDLTITTMIKAPDGVSVTDLTLLQTGGKTADLTTYPIEDVLMLEKDKTYLLFLEMTDEGHVLLMGGYQGAATIDSSKVIFPDNEAFRVNALDRLSLSKAILKIQSLMNK